MCVIIVKDKRGTLPKKETLKNCFERNPDGAGFMYVESGKVVIDKGYMNFKSFYRHYKRLCKKFDNFENKNLVMHMRISTSGGVERENTHPYPITDNFEDMFKLYYRTDVGLAHNGIISATKPSKEQESKKINDTMLFNKIYLADIYEHWSECFDNQAFLAGIAEITNSKFAILDKEDNLHTIGSFTDYDGAKFSNTSYISYKYDGYKYGTYKSYNYDGYDQYGYYDDYGYKYDKYGNCISDSYYDDDITEYNNIEDEDNIIMLEDDDLYIFDYDKDEYKRIETLRTEKNSIFIFDKSTYKLREMAPDMKRIIKTYTDAFVWDSSRKVLY